MQSINRQFSKIWPECKGPNEWSSNLVRNLKDLSRVSIGEDDTSHTSGKCSEVCPPS